MMIKTQEINKIFNTAIKNYHIKDVVDQPFINIFEKEKTLQTLLYEKCWIDTVQWHYEDIIRNPEINPKKAIEIKRKIDKSNQQRTDIVELIDDYFYEKFKEIKLSEKVQMNTESPGWAIDRLSILNLKIFHWNEETKRPDADEKHKKNATDKLNILLKQYNFLNSAIDQLINNMSKGLTITATFKQMKMYNDKETNPVLRKLKNKNH